MYVLCPNYFSVCGQSQAQAAAYPTLWTALWVKAQQNRREGSYLPMLLHPW